jgi:excisionase family DNA binding protein
MPIFDLSLQLSTVSWDPFTMRTIAFDQKEVGLLLPSEAAKLLRIHEETCRRFCRENRFKTVIKLGRGWRIPTTEIERILRDGGCPELN